MKIRLGACCGPDNVVMAEEDGVEEGGGGCWVTPNPLRALWPRGIMPTPMRCRHCEGCSNP